jgi:hypothetical protein
MSQPASDAAVNENKIVRAKGASGITFSCREKETRKTVHLPEILFVFRENSIPQRVAGNQHGEAASV